MKPNLIPVSIVDDESELRESIVRYLRVTNQFRCVSEYRSAEEALRKLPADKPKVVLMDIKMEGMDGIECAKQLKELMPDVQIIMLTVFEDADLIFDALRAGATGYLLKSQPPNKLIEAIQEALDGGSPMSAPIARKVVKFIQQGFAGRDESQRLLLPERQRQVLELLAAGESYKMIADSLGVSIHTVRGYLRRIYEKLQVHSRGEAVAKYRVR